MTKLTLLIWGIVLLTACASTPVEFVEVQPMLNKGSVVYVYRPLVLANAMVSPKVMLNGNVLFELENATYQYHTVAPGKQFFSLGTEERYRGNKSITLDVKPDSRYFLRVTSSTKFEMNKPYTRTFDLEQVVDSIGLVELGRIPAAKTAIERQKITTSSSSIETEAVEFSINKSRNPFSK